MGRHTATRPAGTIIITDPDLSHDVHMDTLQCTHCQKHWVVRPGSGRVRGFCLKCMGPTCGARACETSCVPAEKQLEAMESGIILEA